ncbi:hypothetical protein D3C72_1184640 [compost metagenome]
MKQPLRVLHRRGRRDFTAVGTQVLIPQPLAAVIQLRRNQAIDHRRALPGAAHRVNARRRCSNDGQINGDIQDVIEGFMGVTLAPGLHPVIDPTQQVPGGHGKQ